MRRLAGGIKAVGEPPLNPAALAGHVAAIEAVVCFLAPKRPGPGLGGHRPPLGAAKLRKIFHWPTCPDLGSGSPGEARRAVSKSVEWAAGVWETRLRRGRRGGGVSGPGKRHGGPSKAEVRAFLLTAKLLAEVVESCGLALGEAFEEVCDEVNTGVPGRDVRGGGGGGAGVLDGDPRLHAPLDTESLSAFLCDLLRALCGRDWCGEMSRALLSRVRPSVLEARGARLRLLLIGRSSIPWALVQGFA